MPQGNKENLLDYIKRIGTGAYVKEAAEAKSTGNFRRKYFKKTGKILLLPPGLKKGGFALKYYKDIL
jgi:hypothetical protein|tara:strand:- start:514 stop:714 length:201 start_codon:yes stop_codon:yes gene_type:complete